MMIDVICGMSYEPQHDSFKILITRKLLIIAGIEVNPGPKRGYFELLKNNENSENKTKVKIIERQEAPGTSNTSLLTRVENLEKAMVVKDKLIEDLRKDLQEIKRELIAVKRVLPNINENEDSTEMGDNSENDITDDRTRGLLIQNFPSIIGLDVFAQTACELGNWRACWHYLRENLKDEDLLSSELSICNSRPFYTSNILKEAVKSCCLELIALFLKNGFPVNYPVENVNYEKNTLLHVAAKYGQLSVMDFLLLNDAEVDAKNDAGFTALHNAVQNNQIDAVRKLVLSGASLNAQDNLGKTPLHLAFQHSFSNIAMLLLDEGCDPSLVDLHGKTPLRESSSYNQLFEGTGDLSDGDDN